jgi:rhodanese-related sulfurtransferase
MASRRTIDGLLDGVREHLLRVTPPEAHSSALNGGVIVDIRSVDEQMRQGVLIPGALHHPLSVLLWRLDPDVETSNPKLPLNTRVILICREGYCSTLAAATLCEIGFTRATDVIGGVDAWVRSGLPVQRFPGSRD